MDTLLRETALIFLSLLLLAAPGFAQQDAARQDAARQSAARQDTLTISGAILESDSLQPLQGATVTNINSGQVQKTTDEGDFHIRVQPGDTLLIKRMAYRTVRYFVPKDLQASQYALVQLLQQEQARKATDIRAFPSQLQFEQSLLRTDPGRLSTRDAALDLHLERVTNDPTRMQQYIDDYMRYQQLYVLPEQGRPNNFINPERWRNFLRDWREGRFDEAGVEKLEGYPAELEDEDNKRD